MKILVYGAGVIGCELAHELCQGGNDVTILARGKWQETIQQNGLIIRHYGQLRTTTDSIKTIELLKQRVVSMHFKKVSMTIGGLNGPLSANFLQLLQTAFLKTDYQLNWESHMEGWLLSHAAHILPTAYLCYIHNGHLKHSTKEQIHLAVDAVAQAHQMLRQLGYPIRPDGEEDAYTKSRTKKLRSLYLMVKSPAGKFVITTHCTNAAAEMTSLSNAFDQLRQKSNVPMPAWDRLLQEVPMKEIATTESGLSH